LPVPENAFGAAEVAHAHCNRSCGALTRSNYRSLDCRLAHRTDRSAAPYIFR
jgi:hypothetical protein